MKRKDNEVPDVGKEEQYELEKAGKDSMVLEVENPEGSDSDDDVEEEEYVETKKSKKLRGGRVVEQVSNIETEKLEARVEALKETMKGYSERISRLSEQIGEIRTMAINNEKDIISSSTAVSKAVDIVREVKPQELRIDYQKANLKIQTVDEKIEATKQLMESVMSEVKDLRTKAGIFVGTDALLKLNEDVKKDLIELQKTASKVRLNADKSEELFIEMRKGFAESQKTNELVSNLDSNYAGLKKEIEKLKVDYQTIVKQADLANFQKGLNSKLVIFSEAAMDIEKMKEENVRLAQLMETVASISKRNKEDIANVALSVGDDKIQSVSDYENQVSSILNILDTLAGQINELRKKEKLPEAKTFVKPSVQVKVGDENIKMEHIHLHPKVSRGIVNKPQSSKEKLKNSSHQVVSNFHQKLGIRKRHLPRAEKAHKEHLHSEEKFHKKNSASASRHREIRKVLLDLRKKMDKIKPRREIKLRILKKHPSLKKHKHHKEVDVSRKAHKTIEAITKAYEDKYEKENKKFFKKLKKI
ncbi:MAG: hypothetical protein WCP89_00955 [archaeon]